MLVEVVETIAFVLSQVVEFISVGVYATLVLSKYYGITDEIFYVGDRQPRDPPSPSLPECDCWC